jgi:hypothetical protein
MPKLKEWAIPRGIKPFLTGRKIKTTLMGRVDMLLRGKLIPRPLWYDAALAHPPGLRINPINKPQAITFPEDELRHEWIRRNPAATMVPKSLFLEEESVPPELRTHPGDTFTERQMELIEQGVDPDEAYNMVKAEQEREGSVRALEDQSARKVAAALGAAPADEGEGGRMRVQTQLLRRFAEEARDMGLPYPKHWFDHDGSWKGMGAQLLRASLDGSTRRALDKKAGAAAGSAGGRGRPGDDLMSAIRDDSNDGGNGGGSV